MSHKTIIGGTVYEVKGGKCLVNGTSYDIKKGRTLINGTGYDISFGTPLGELAVGTSVYMNVNGTRSEFLVVHQGKPSSDYDDSCSGTWLLMKDCYEKREWRFTTQYGEYSNSTINKYLNETFLGLFDSDIKSAIKKAKIPVQTSTLACKVFLLSGNEVGLAGTPYLRAEGVKLDYFNANRGNDAKRIAYLSGEAVDWWTRTQTTDGTSYAFYINASGGYNNQYLNCSYGIRPALILPPELMVDSDYNILTE